MAAFSPCHLMRQRLGLTPIGFLFPFASLAEFHSVPWHSNLAITFYNSFPGAAMTEVTCLRDAGHVTV
jgi:hypothetical protein